MSQEMTVPPILGGLPRFNSLCGFPVVLHNPDVEYEQVYLFPLGKRGMVRNPVYDWPKQMKQEYSFTATWDADTEAIEDMFAAEQFERDVQSPRYRAERIL